jgi:hypothetical protein
MNDFFFVFVVSNFCVLPLISSLRRLSFVAVHGLRVGVGADVDVDVAVDVVDRQVAPRGVVDVRPVL